MPRWHGEVTIVPADEGGSRAAAGDKIVGVATPDLARQLLNARQLDEINVNLVPVLLGGGVALFANLASAPIRLHGPTVIEGTGVTHLNYRVTYS